MTSDEKKEILESYKWIKVKRFKREDYPDDKSAYDALEKHHLEETNFLIEKLREIVKTYC